jgi:hypothetical protein
MSATPIYGLMAQFSTPDAVIDAVEHAKKAGYHKMEAYTPFPIEALNDALGYKPKIQYLVLLGGIIGALSGFALQYYASVISYPIIVGGRPFNSFPAFIVVIFELTILLAAFAAVFGTLGLSGFPNPYHPVFNAPGFDRASKDKFFLCIEADDIRFNTVQTKAFLESLGPDAVVEVEP